ncbi:NACHT, LRR and PYD domains-containing protein 1 homolog [Engraulis encrasicolus]|uniref:NACHT, LRR and PYD domains-containing protein 1 homolog n=1 Tax=Engraulis encrasicolus TaxID=184585 RepID=UPI002FD5D122
MDWYMFTEELARMQCSPAGPLMDIKLTSGELEEIHLPHFLCLGGVEAAHNAVRLLHAQDSGVYLETCTVTQHHASLLQPSLSLLGPVYYLLDLLSPKVHCQLLLFYQRTTILKLRTYLVLNNQEHIDAIHKQEENWKGERIKRNSTVGSPLRLGDTFHVMTSCPSKIDPGEVKLVPDKVGSMGNFCVVSFNIKHPEESFDVQVKRPQHEDPIWKISVEKEDYSPPSTSPNLHSTSSSTKTQTVDLFSTFDELQEKELKRFKAYLSLENMEGFERIPRGQLEKWDATDLATRMTERYEKEGAVRMTLTILRKMELNDLANRLEESITLTGQ